MAINSRFAVATHILSLIDLSAGTRLTSEIMAGSVNTNPVVIRRILGQLSKAGLVRTNAGVAGASLARPVEEITLLDVYRAVQPEGEELFSSHEQPNPDCQVGRHIQGSLDMVFGRAQDALERELASVTVAEISRDIVQRSQ